VRKVEPGEKYKCLLNSRYGDKNYGYGSSRKA